MAETFIEGYTKFNCDWKKSEPIESDAIEALIRWRQKLYGLRLIGVLPDGVGYGNISVREKTGSRKFLITGTQTGGIKVLTKEHITEVVGVDFEKNFVACRGPIAASSESMTHEAAYLSDRSVNAVVHIHNRPFWKHLLHKVPTTAKSARYGTPEMAREVKRLFEEDSRIWIERVIAMEGHADGILSFGTSLDEAGNALLEQYEKFSRNQPTR